MHHKPLLRIFAFITLAISASGAMAAEPQWREWQADSLGEARREGKPIYLYLEAVWCHWCHVMQQTTLRDKTVVERLNRDFIPIRVDHDAHPALADRYRDWGWPAHVFIGTDGVEIALRSGYLAPDPFAELLAAIHEDPSPEAGAGLPSVERAASPQLADALAAELLRRHRSSHDDERGGLRTAQKYLDRAHVELAMDLALAGDADAARRARQTLDAARALIDPAWGGVYQYSTGGRWDRPHYEKLLRIQAAYLEIYTLAHALWPQAGYLQDARRILRYTQERLQAPDGLYYNSQDADLVPGRKAHDYFALDAAGRARLGEPRIDRNRHVLGNAEMVPALLRWDAQTADATARAQATGIGRWLLDQRQGDLVARDSGIFLSDNLAASRAWLSLYEHTADRMWLDHASLAARASLKAFAATPAGFLPTRAGDSLLPPLPLLEDNILAARLFNRLHHYTGEADFARAAHQAMSFLGSEKVALHRIEESGILLAARELGRAPLHLTVVGATDDAMARALFARALKVPGRYRRIEWTDGHTPLPHPDVSYPQLQRAAGFVCTDARCSRPAFEPDAYGRMIEALVFAGPTGAMRPEPVRNRGVAAFRADD